MACDVRELLALSLVSVFNNAGDPGAKGRGTDRSTLPSPGKGDKQLEGGSLPNTLGLEQVVL